MKLGIVPNGQGWAPIAARLVLFGETRPHGKLPAVVPAHWDLGTGREVTVMNRAALLRQRMGQTALRYSWPRRTPLADGRKGDPRFGQQAGAQQLRQDRGVDLGVLRR
jgi:predicted alpha/beta-hydrolase family hydrolase